MSNKKFNWKSLFINESDVAQIDTKKTPDVTSVKASTTSTKFPTDTIKNKPIEASKKAVNNSVLNSVVEMYESGFDSLNMPGYDFYEFFKAIKAVGSNDPSLYKMAMTMAQSVDSKVSKEHLLKGAQFYIDEINKVHQQYSVKGNAKRTQIINNQQKEKETLLNEINTLEKQLIELQTKISEKKIKLDTADGSLLSEVTEIEQKITANDMAKSKITNTIMDVVNGIKNNL